MDFEDVKSNIRSGIYENKMDFPKTSRYKYDYVFDENQSVKWNREEAQRQNKMITDATEQYYDESNKLSKQFEKDLTRAIIEFLGISASKANFIFNKAYDNTHGSGYLDVVLVAEDLSDLVYDVMREE